MVYDLYSKRCKAERGECLDVYQYDVLPQPLKVQIIHLFDRGHYSEKKKAFENACKILREERGVFKLPRQEKHVAYNNYDTSSEGELKNYFLKETNIEHALDVIELFSRQLRNSSNKNDLIESLNIRFREHGVGYAYEANRIIRVDNQLIHSEIVKPALKLVHTQEFSNVEEEYLKAHEHYKHGRHAEALVECLKALETTMKIIADKHKWQFDPKDSASRLINVMLDNNLIPSYLQTHFNALKACLESCVPTVRNKVGGHGQGNVKIDIPNYLAGYIINSTAVNILLLVEAEKALR